jgi:hypothetical protein
MIGFPEMLVAPAEKAGIKTPPDADNFDAKDFPHFAVFLNLQLGRRMPTPVSHWYNAKIIAAIPEDKIRTITTDEVLGLGFD